MEKCVCGGEWFIPLMKPSPSGTLHTPAYPDAVMCATCKSVYPVDPVTSIVADPERAKR